MKTLGLTLTRKNSQGVKNKNTRLVYGKPLVQWTIEAALASTTLDHYVIGTDDVKVMQIADRFNVCCIRLPSNLTQSDSPIIGSIRDVVRQLGNEYDVIVDIRATNPLKTAEDIDACVRLVRDDGAFIATGVSPATPPERIKYIENNRLVDVIPEPTLGIRQGLRDAYVRNGSVYALSRAALDAGVLFGDDVAVAHIMPPERATNIDTEFDLMVAEMLLERRVG